MDRGLASKNVHGVENYSYHAISRNLASFPLFQCSGES